jgi:hypothetical protein
MMYDRDDMQKGMMMKTESMPTTPATPAVK